MEGFLTIVRSGLGGGASRAWAVLDAQQLSYYEDFDLQAQCPRRFRGSLPVREATVEKFSDAEHGLPFALKVRAAAASKESKTQQKLVCACEDAAQCSAWYNALQRASKAHREDEARLTKPLEHKKTLGLAHVEDGELTQNMISRAYKKLCLSAHPDKGGDPDTFNRIREAYLPLLSHQQMVDELRATESVQFEALVEKVPGSGLCIGVMEDKLKRQIIVQSVGEKARIHGITEESQGEIRPGDVLIGIDKDDVSLWWLSRVRARLDNFRIPPGETVLLTFERRVRREELDEYMAIAHAKANEREEEQKRGEEDEEEEDDNEDDQSQEYESEQENDFDHRDQERERERDQERERERERAQQEYEQKEQEKRFQRQKEVEEHEEQQRRDLNEASAGEERSTAQKSIPSAREETKPIILFAEIKEDENNKPSVSLESTDSEKKREGESPKKSSPKEAVSPRKTTITLEDEESVSAMPPPPSYSPPLSPYPPSSPSPPLSPSSSVSSLHSRQSNLSHSHYPFRPNSSPLHALFPSTLADNEDTLPPTNGDHLKHEEEVEEAEEEMEEDFVLKSDYDLLAAEVERLKAEQEEANQHAGDLHAAHMENDALLRDLFEQQQLNETLNMEIQNLREMNTQLSMQNLSLNNIVDNNWHTFDGQQMKEQVLLLQQKIMDFDSQQRELLFHIEQKSKKESNADPSFKSIVQRKEVYRDREDRAQRMIDALKALCK